MTRDDFRRLAEMRALDGAALVAAGRPEAAYYLLGYAVECALKACVARQVRAFDFPDKKLATRVFTHDLKELLRAAGLQNDLAARIAADRAFEDHWAFIIDWSEEARYRPTIPAGDGAKMLKAVTDPTSGVLPWLTGYW